MGNNNMSLVISFLILILNCCNTNNYSDNPNQTLKHEKETFGKETNIKNLLDHFPEKINKRNVYFELNPPSCPPTYKCRAQYGDVFLCVKISDYKEDINKLIKNKIIYKTAYLDSNIIINLDEFKHNIFPNEKCNKWHPKKIPIPYFEKYDFGLGKKEIKKTINDELYFNYTYIIPLDLNVFVIMAEPGEIWKINCKEKRPETLNEWKHGYSRGYAISEKEKIIVYWVVVW